MAINENDKTIPKGWKKVKLGEVLELFYGKGLKESDRIIGNYPVYGSNGIVGFHNEYLVEAPGIIIGRKGTVGEVKLSKINFYPIDTTYYAKLKNNNDIFFFYYLLKTLKLNEMNSHSAVPGLNRDAVYSLEILLPPLSEQKAIASVLSSLDDKIDLLHRQNQTLEKMAETLFRKWFIEDAKEDWEEVKLGEIIEISSGKGLKKNEFVENGLYPVLGANGEIGKTNNFLFNEPLIFTGRVGTLGNVFISEGKVWLSDNTLIIKPITQEYFYLVYFFLKMAKLEELNVGSTQPLIRQTDLKELDIIIPDNETINKFHKFVDQIFNKIKYNKQQIRTLEQMRDALLPKLMNGEVRIMNNEQ